jgi:hypothetical protein
MARSANARVSLTAWALASRNSALVRTSVDSRALRCASQVMAAPVNRTSPQTPSMSCARKLSPRAGRDLAAASSRRIFEALEIMPLRFG